MLLLPCYYYHATIIMLPSLHYCPHATITSPHYHPHAIISTWLYHTHVNIPCYNPILLYHLNATTPMLLSLCYHPHATIPSYHPCTPSPFYHPHIYPHATIPMLLSPCYRLHCTICMLPTPFYCPHNTTSFEKYKMTKIELQKTIPFWKGTTTKMILLYTGWAIRQKMPQKMNFLENGASLK